MLNDFTALHLRATYDFTDVYGNKRRAGEEWLIDKSVKDVHIIDAAEQLVQEKRIIILSQTQYCIIQNPINAKTAKPDFGQQKVVRGEAKFFLRPGEELVSGIQNIMVIHEEEALLCRARVNYFDKRTKKDYKPGQKWLIKGPIDFIPENEIEVIEKRSATPLAENEGIYVRDLWNGQVKLVKGPQTYLLNEYEEVWEKSTSPDIEQLLALNASGVDYIPSSDDGKGGVQYDYRKVKPRQNKYLAMTFKAPHNSAVQLFDFKNKHARIVFGPELIMLEPYEEFTLITLSGG